MSSEDAPFSASLNGRTINMGITQESDCRPPGHAPARAAWSGDPSPGPDQAEQGEELMIKAAGDCSVLSTIESLTW